MRINRFLVEFDPKQTEIKITDENLINQIKNVLKLSLEHVVNLFNGRGEEVLAEVITLNKKEVVFSVQEVFTSKDNGDKRVILYCAILKKENFELVAQKGTEVGVSKIVPIITERTIKLGLNMERLQKIVKEAAEQSGRGIVTEISEPIKFIEALEQAKENDVNFFCHFSNKSINKIKANGQIGLFIGPEGGWSDGEVEQAKEEGCEVVALGENVLRAETAAIVSTYLISNL
ncbi:MAG: RsmE family RNA methyltransferase [Minisyncoccia bacterium]